MGLDMYLSKRTYVKQWNHQKDEEKHKVAVKLGGKARRDIRPNKISHIVEEVGYWRKANHIHNWFVDNCQDGIDECQEASVDIEQLKELRDICSEVVKKKDAEFSSENLPTGSGFFFGNTEYNEYYYEDCKDTIKIIDEIIKSEEVKPEGCYSSYYYQSSW